jgi:hypothetical protein
MLHIFFSFAGVFCGIAILVGGSNRSSSVGSVGILGRIAILHGRDSVIVFSFISVFSFIFVVSIEPRLRSEAGGVRDEEASK